MQILIDKDGVVVAKSNINTIGENKYEVNGSILPEHLDLNLIEFNGDPTLQKHKIVNGVMSDNGKFVEEVDKDKIIADMAALLIEGGIL